MHTGTKISLAGHGLLMGWVVFGAWFPSEPLPSQVQDVSLISVAEFERLSQQTAAPDIAAQPPALATPQTGSLPDVAADVAAPAEVVPPVPVSPSAPDVEVQDRPDPLPQSQPEAVAEIAALPPTDVPEIPTDFSQRRPPEAGQNVDRVAPVAVAPPPPEAAPDDVVQPEIAPNDGADTPAEPQTATAPEAATDRIVTEDNQSDAPAVSAAPRQSLRPKRRPDRPEPVETARPEPAVQTPAEPSTAASEPATDRADAVGDALAEALAGGGDVQAPEPSGPPLTRGEKDALRVAVSSCWNVGSLSSEALRTTVVVAVSLSQDGRPDLASLRMVSSTGGTAGAAKQAYAAARRAIIRCGAKGFQLPPEKYAQWRDIEITFNPERMRIR